MNAPGAAVGGLDVLARLSFDDAKAAGGCRNVRAKRRTGKALAIQAVADADGARFNLGLIGNGATVTVAFDLHAEPPFPRGRWRAFLQARCDRRHPPR